MFPLGPFFLISHKYVGRYNVGPLSSVELAWLSG